MKKYVYAASVAMLLATTGHVVIAKAQDTTPAVVTNNGEVADMTVAAVDNDDRGNESASDTVPSGADEWLAVCNSDAAKTDALMTACANDDMPKRLKSGARFTKRGIGGEVNTIYRNIAFFTVEEIE